jgi:predicted nucleic acid-binding protein
MVFLDTSALYALADRADKNHRSAKDLFRKALIGGKELWLHSYVIVEAVALIHHRLGHAPAKKFLNDALLFRVAWVDGSLHQAAADFFLRRAKSKISFVDCVSFVLMRQKGIRTALAFDEDFVQAGFQMYS